MVGKMRDKRYDYPITEKKIQSLLKDWTKERRIVADSIRLIKEDAEMFYYPSGQSYDKDRVQSQYNQSDQIEQLFSRIRNADNFTREMIEELTFKYRFQNKLFRELHSLPTLKKDALIQVYLMKVDVKDLAKSENIGEDALYRRMRDGVKIITDKMKGSGTRADVVEKEIM